MISFEEAKRTILNHASPLPAQNVSLDAALNLVLAEDLVAPVDMPLFDNSMVDGYAVSSRNLQDFYDLAGKVKAGDAPLTLGQGQCFRVFTGSALPIGADAVMMQEDARVSDSRVTFTETPTPGLHVRRRGSECSAGTKLLSAGRVVDPGVISASATFGMTELRVVPAPRIAIVSTGNELVPPGQKLAPGQVWESNRIGLVSAAESLGLPVVCAKSVPDDLQSLKAALDEALNQADVVVTSGGVSVGEYDLVRPALRELGVEEVYWRVAVKPGKPTFFGMKGDKLVFGLPGNPVPALLMFQVLVRPAILKMMCRQDEAMGRAILKSSVTKYEARHELVRAVTHNGEVESVESQGSNMISGLARANCVIHFPAERTGLEAGDEVEICMMKWGPS